MDGLSGLEKVFAEEFINAKIQRCQIHVSRNVLCKVPKKMKPEIADRIRDIFYASSKRKAMANYRLFVEKYQNVKFIFGHAGGRYNAHRAAVRIAKEYDNAFLDISGDSTWFGFLEWLVDAAGAGKILYGSDITWIDPRTQLGMVLGANISDEAKMSILRTNAVRVFGLSEGE